MFGNSNKESRDTELETVKREMQETKARFFVFIDKLEATLKEFVEASIPELIEVNNSDTDEFKRTYHRMKSGVLGQLSTLVKKADKVKEEKITNFPVPTDNPELRNTYHSFRNECYERFFQLDKISQDYKKRIEATFSEDYETKYQKILDEYEAIKDTFRCVQCSSPITIDKLYFTTTYITCPACQIKNTFEPSSQAKMLETLGRSLAEQRTAHLLVEHDAIPEQTRVLYLQKHDLKLSLSFEKDENTIEQNKAKIQELENQEQELEAKRPELYQNYLRAMFDEWNKINPALAGEHEKFYKRLLSDYKIRE